MPLQIIGAGCGRTGTASLKRALEILGYPCYHMEECLKRDHFDKWIRAAEPGYDDWEDIFSGFKATVDFPACTFYRELMIANPEAKCILSTRDAESWFDSVQETIWHPKGLEFNWIFRLLPMFRRFQAMSNVYRSRFIARSVDTADKQRVIQAFNSWNRKVKEDVPPQNLLVFSPKEGWGPICKFLDCPIPNVPFPKVNDTNQFKRIILTLRATFGTAWLGVSFGMFFASKKMIFIVSQAYPWLTEYAAGSSNSPALALTAASLLLTRTLI